MQRQQPVGAAAFGSPMRGESSRGGEREPHVCGTSQGQEDEVAGFLKFMTSVTPFGIAGYFQQQGMVTGEKWSELSESSDVTD